MGITPADSPGDAEGFASVTPHGPGPAPYNIQAPMDDLTGVTDAATALAGGQEGASTGPGMPNRMGPRQAQAQALLESAPGFASDGYDIIAGYHGDGGDGWPNDIEPVTAGP
jgi:hypothetical protein